MRRLLASSIVAALVIACGGTTTNADAGSDAQQDVAPDTSGTYPCGTSQCQSGDICVHPCCGGTMAQCTPFEDGGTCPAGSTPSGQCPNLGTPGCAPQSCTPPPPFCSPGNQPQSCTATNPSTPRDCYESCA